jgi:hypothetical protein
LHPVLTITQSAGIDPSPITGMGHILAKTGRASLLLLGFIGLLLGIRYLVFRRKPVETGPTWGCGYIAPHPMMQYTGKSFSKSLAKLFGFITIENKTYKELKTESIFPSPRSYASYYLGFFENRIFDPAIRQFLRIFNVFSFIHNGKIQLYVLYGLIFMVILIILSVLNIL